MSDKVLDALQALGLDPADVDAGVLKGLRAAADAGPAQLSRDDLAGMEPAEIVAAEQAGKLDAVLGRQGDRP